MSLLAKLTPHRGVNLMKISAFLVHRGTCTGGTASTTTTSSSRGCVVGDCAELRRVFSLKDVEAFAALSLDNNPLHLDKDVASQSIFKQRVVHGVLVHSMVAALLGTQMPGPGSIYLSQTLQFTAPVFLDEEVVARVEVLERRRSTAIIETTCTVPARDKIVQKGQAIVKCP